MHLPKWLDFSFVAGAASILGFLLTVFGGAKLLQRLRQRSSVKGSPRGNLVSTSAANTTGNVIVIGGNVGIAADEFLSYLENAKGSIVSDARPTGGSSGPRDEHLGALVRDLEVLLARHTSSISDVLLAAHRLAKYREDRAIMRWLECEMDGYSETEVSSLPEEQTRYRRIKGYVLMSFGPAGRKQFDRLPYPFFEAKSAARLEEVVRTVGPSREPASITISTPQWVRDFSSRQKLDIEIPPVLTVFIEPDQLASILTELRKRIRGYLGTLC